MLDNTQDVVLGLKNVIDFVYALQPNQKCHDMKSEYVYCADLTGCGLGLTARAWEYQVCTDVPLQASSTGVQDMFFNQKYTIDDISNVCVNKYGVKPSVDNFALYHGNTDLAKITNHMILTNGALDPWGPGGYSSDLSDTILYWEVQSGAHHLELRQDDSRDPDDVKQVRNEIEQTIGKWLGVL